MNDMTELPEDRIRRAAELLRDLGWTQDSRHLDQFESWIDSDETVELILPLDPSAGDFEGLMDRLLRRLRSYDSHRFDLVQNMTKTTADASLEETQWHVETALPPGLIAWEGGEALHVQAREQLAASAKASVRKRRYHGNRSSYVASSFLSQTYMGVPKAASYVITALTPRDANLYTSKGARTRALSSEERLVDPEVITGAEILTTYERALRAMRAGLDEYARTPRIDPFMEAISEGVSYELSRSLEAIVASGDTGISIFRGLRSTASVEIEFKAREADVLGRVTSALAVDTEPRRVRVTGEVTLLKREHGSHDRVIRLDVLSGDTDLNKARIRLSAEQYEVAIDAHRSQRALDVTGIVVREGNLFWMYQVESLGVVDAPPSDPSGAETLPLTIQDELTGYDK